MSNIRPGSFGDAPQPPEPGSVLPAPRPSGGALGFVKAAPLWAKLAAPIAAVIIVAGIAGASGSGKKSAAIAAASSTTVQSTTTTAATTTTQAATTTEPRTSVAPATVPPATAPRATAPPATVPPTEPRTTPPTPPPTQGGPGNPGDSKNCSDFATYAQAKAWFDTYFPRYGDVAHLDADGDGIPCESLPGAP